MLDGMTAGKLILRAPCALTSRNALSITETAHVWPYVFLVAPETKVIDLWAYFFQTFAAVQLTRELRRSFQRAVIDQVDHPCDMGQQSLYSTLHFHVASLSTIVGSHT